MGDIYETGDVFSIKKNIYMDPKENIRECFFSSKTIWIYMERSE